MAVRVRVAVAAALARDVELAGGQDLVGGLAQARLEADEAETRLVLVTDLLRSELRAMNVIASLPATEVARTRWSPN